MKPRVWRKNRKLFWYYPWVAFNGYRYVEFMTWEEAMEFALWTYKGDKNL